MCPPPTSADAAAAHETLVALDLLPMAPIPHCCFLEGDFLSQQVQQQLSVALGGMGCDVVLSDMLHNTSGRASDDHFKSMELVYSVLHFAERHLAPGGAVLAKVSARRGGGFVPSAVHARVCECVCVHATRS
mgnify:CR=1 FL=1